MERERRLPTTTDPHSARLPMANGDNLPETSAGMSTSNNNHNSSTTGGASVASGNSGIEGERDGGVQPGDSTVGQQLVVPAETPDPRQLPAVISFFASLALVFGRLLYIELVPGEQMLKYGKIM